MEKAYQEDFWVRKTFSIPNMVLTKSEVRYFRDADSTEANILADVLRDDIPDIVVVKIKPDRYPGKTNPRRGVSTSV